MRIILISKIKNKLNNKCMDKVITTQIKNKHVNILFKQRSQSSQFNKPNSNSNRLSNSTLRNRYSESLLIEFPIRTLYKKKLPCLLASLSNLMVNNLM
jgi:hypothetical protein